jgi:glucosamine--fructose-6-phosphate aminotransferase (isomerizing)
MCGIFGVVAGAEAARDRAGLRQLVDSFFLLSESRGKEAAGIAVDAGADPILVQKEPLPASRMIRTTRYTELFETIGRPASAVTIIGHSRLVTNGNQLANDNNQPVSAGGLIGVHNGIVVNDAAIWGRHPELRRAAEVDTEIILALLSLYALQKDLGPEEAARRTFAEIEGSASVAIFIQDQLLLATNTGSLYLWRDAGDRSLLFASEKYILDEALGNGAGRRLASGPGNGREVIKVQPGRALLVDRRTLACREFSLDSGAANAAPPTGGTYVEYRTRMKRMQVGGAEGWQERLRRCTRCILPETMPFIEFDRDGVCNFCRCYQPMRAKGKDALYETLDRFRSRSGNPDCVVGFSGGRDSSFGLHYIKNVLRMNPVAFTYDWGMVNDLARRNQARLCGRLGVEHIVVSADIAKKRENIRKNVTAWLRRPDLGLIPLFMAGDKQFFYFARQVSRQTGAQLVIFCENKLEKTDFKAGFCGISTVGTNVLSDGLSAAARLRMAAHYGRAFVLNPHHFNSSLLDTATAAWSYYLMPLRFVSFYEHIEFDEALVEKTIIEEYGWELAPDTPSSWRIGDGTAPFYNFIYYTVAGFTEADTFRSNQVREGLLTRQQALEMVRTENRPRHDAIRWYCEQVGLDYPAVVDAIRRIPPLASAAPAGGDKLSGHRM